MKYKEALAEIKASLVNANEQAEPTPFFLLVGAGISVPTIPLASEITGDLRERAGKLGFDMEGPRDPGEAYSFWFEKAFPSAIERARYLRNLMKGKPVSPGSFNLAKLLSYEMNQRPYFDLALTTNFDDFIDRALTVLGVSHYTHAHPIALDQVDLSTMSERQVVHLHGSFRFYSCRNTEPEIRQTNAVAFFEDRVVQDFLVRLMPFRMPIVVGYGGWEGDVFMRAMDRVFSQRQLPRNAYWFCYDGDDARALPDRMTAHPALNLVEPEDPPLDAARIFDDISQMLPSSSFKPEGGALAMAVSLLNGTNEAGPLPDSSDNSLAGVFEAMTKSVDVEEITSVGPPWTHFVALLDANLHREAWNAILASGVKPKSDFHSLTLLSVLASISEALSHDQALLKALSAMAGDLEITRESCLRPAEQLRERIAANVHRAEAENAESKAVFEGLRCAGCQSPMQLFAEDAEAARGFSVNITCLKCGALHALTPKELELRMVKRGRELDYIWQKYE